MHHAVAIYTSESADSILEHGFTGNWGTRAERVSEYRYVVCIRNGRHPSAPNDVPNGTAFLVGMIGNVWEVSEATQDGRPRVAIGISEVAEVRVEGAWGKNRNPVWYTTLEELGIDPEGLEFIPVEPAETPKIVTSAIKPLSFEEARAGIAQFYKVPPKNVEISIRG